MTVFYLVKDYIEVVHKLIETSPNIVLPHSNYTDALTILNFGLSTLKQFCSNFLSFEWLKQLWYFPIIVPEIATSMMEEISVLDGNFHNILTFLDKPIAVGNQIYGDFYLPLTCFEKIFTGLVNSLFIWIPTSTATFLCFRRFIMQGVEAGYAAALGTMAASLFWLTSIIFGLRFIVVPWMSLDLFRYWLGFLLLMKYFWDNRFAYKEVKHNSVFGKKTKMNIFGFHFLLALTEQTSLYPFLNNFSISAQSTMMESFPSENFFDFSCIHFSYLLGIGIGSYSLINLICWFWQDPAYRFYFWLMNKFKKLRVADIVRPVHLFFQSITVLFAFSSLPYFGIEYQITNPLGFLPNDQVFHQFKQTNFLTHPTSPAYYRSRLNFPKQKFFRYEDWAEYYHRNTPLDTSLYDQGAYRLYTMEDLSYGKDYEWMRRRSDKIKIRSRLKRLRWFPRNWANRLWEFTKTWSRRNVLWRNDILNMYQYSWDSKAPIVWGKLVFEEFFPSNSRNQKIAKINGFGEREVSHFSSFSNNDTTKPMSKNWDSFWGPDPDWTSKFLWNQNSLNNKEKQFWWNWQSRVNLSDNDTWWKWLITGSKNKKEKELDKEVQTTLQNSINQSSNKTLKGDFWEPQKRLISIYSENSKQKESSLESSILRKFSRKLSARFKLANILNFYSSRKIPNSKDNFNKIFYKTSSVASVKTLLLTPSIKNWTVFQTVMSNINQMLWWRRLSNVPKSKNELNQLNFRQNKEWNNGSTDFRQNNQLKTSKNIELKNLKTFKNSLFKDKNSSKSYNTNPGNLTALNGSYSKLPKLIESSGTMTSQLIHPLNYYLHKEQNFKRKLSFYGVTQKLTKSFKNESDFSADIRIMPEQKNLFTKLESRKGNLKQVSKNKNNLPIFNFYLKTYFQTYKKTKLYERSVTKMKRQLGMGASARRKGRDYSNKLLKRSRILSNTPWIRQWIDQSGFLARRKRLETWIARQHYDPNELWSKIMKVDVDLFMGRQPSNYFLTNTEEKLLHLRRFLLFEHYDSLRWYTYMTNYRTMKNTIGGTKSFTNRIYNQQFKGTFHKVRHLFSLTPSSSNGSLLKFDRPLYNLNSNENIQMHEELPNEFNLTQLNNNLDIIEKSPKTDPFYTLFDRSFLEKKAFEAKTLENNVIRQNYIDQSLKERNYDLVTKLLLSNTFLSNPSLLNVQGHTSSDVGLVNIPIKIFNDKSRSLNFSTNKPIITDNIHLNTTKSIKTNLQKQLMISLFRKKQKWTKDYKRASEKLWKKWKQRSTISLAARFPLTDLSNKLNDQDNRIDEKDFGNTNFSPINFKLATLSTSNSNSSNLNKKFRQITKLKKLATIPFSPTFSRSFIPITKPVSTTNLTWHYAGKNKETSLKHTNSKNIFKNNLFTKKLIKDRYVQQSRLSLSQTKGIMNKLQDPRDLSFNLSIRSINNRSHNETNKMLTQKNLILYQKNFIRRESSNIQNFIFMKKFLLNDYNNSLTRSQIRPLPGKRTKGLYDSSSRSTDYYNSRSRSFKKTPFFSAINNIDLNINAYKTFLLKKQFNGTAPENLVENTQLQTLSALPNVENSSKTKISEFNTRWKSTLSKLKNSTTIVSDQLDEKLQTKLIQAQNVLILKNKITNTNIAALVKNKRELSKNFLLDDKSVGTLVADKGFFQNLVRQKLTKTILSKQKMLNANPQVIRITKSLRKRQQDRVVRSLLKRHLNLKSRRKLFLKTKELNNQRLILDRKYEIQERLFLNKLSYLDQFQRVLNKKGEAQNENLVNVKIGYPATGLFDINKTKSVDKKDVPLALSQQNFIFKNLNFDNFVTWLNNYNNFSKLNSEIDTNKNFFIFSENEKNKEIKKEDLLDSKLKNGKLINLKDSSTVFTQQNQSYLSSIKRSSSFINKINLNNANILSSDFDKASKDKSVLFFNNKLKQNLQNEAKLLKKNKEPTLAFNKRTFLDNEKTILRRSLRKFSGGDYRNIRKHSGKLKEVKEKINLTNSQKRKNIFVNNLFLKNWLRLENSQKSDRSREFKNQQKTGLLSLKLSSKKDLINLNKYIIFARSNQNKLSRQQMRKKLKKRRIIRSKGHERLQTLKDHPLKFRSEQIQTFYNIRDSLNKWKNFSFISSKLNYNKSVLNDASFVKTYQNSATKATDLPLNLSIPSINYKPLLNNNNTKPNIFSNNETNYFKADSFTNLLNSDLFYILYKDMFIDSEKINNITITKDSQKNLFTQTDNVNSSPNLLNNTNMPFYAGWDESVRKFVLTNRLLSRREAGYEILNNNTNNNNSNSSTNNIVFSSWPLKGKNAATTLFSQFPFMTAPQTNLNYSNKEIKVLKGGTKYEVPGLSNANYLNHDNTKAIVSSDFFSNKWLTSNNSSYKNNNEKATLLNFKNKKRIKTIIKSSKNEDQIGIRQSGQVISNLATPTSRKTAIRNLFSSRPWRGKKQTTKTALLSNSYWHSQRMLTENSTKDSLAESNGTTRKTTKLFMSLNLKNNKLIDKKLSSKILLLRNLKHGNRSQTKLAYIRRLQKFIRPTGSSWKTTLPISRRKKQRIKQNAYFSNRFNVRKRKKRGNNKNPRLRGDKNIKKTKRQYRQKLYLRPKNRPLRRRSLGVLFQNKLNYWRRQYQNLSNKQIGIINSDQKEQILFSKNLKENSIYSQINKKWGSPVRPRKLYRSLFKNPARHTPILYETLPGHSRSIPLIKNVPLPGSSVKTLNRIIKWSSADGASRFYRVNLSYGWALELFLNNLRQKIRLKTGSQAVNTQMNDYLTQLVNTNKKKFSSARFLERRSLKLRQLSYTMSMRLYDRWFFYYYKNFNEPSHSSLPALKSKNDQIKNLNLKDNSSRSLLLLEHIKKFLTFHLTDNQTTFRSYLKNLRNTAYLKTPNLAIENVEKPKSSSNKPNLNSNEFNTVPDSAGINITPGPKNMDGLESFKLTKTNKKADFEQSKSSIYNEDQNTMANSSRSLLKKEKKYAEDRFFFAQFNKPPLVDDSRLTLENNRHYPLNGGFVWPGDYLRLKTILLPKEVKDLYLDSFRPKNIAELKNGETNGVGLHFLKSSKTFKDFKQQNSTLLTSPSSRIESEIGLVNLAKKEKFQTYSDKWSILK